MIMRRRHRGALAPAFLDQPLELVERAGLLRDEVDEGRDRRFGELAEEGAHDLLRHRMAELLG